MTAEGFFAILPTEGRPCPKQRRILCRDFLQILPTPYSPCSMWLATDRVSALLKKVEGLKNAVRDIGSRVKQGEISRADVWKLKRVGRLAEREIEDDTPVAVVNAQRDLSRAASPVVIRLAKRLGVSPIDIHAQWHLPWAPSWDVLAVLAEDGGKTTTGSSTAEKSAKIARYDRQISGLQEILDVGCGPSPGSQYDPVKIGQMLETVWARKRDATTEPATADSRPVPRVETGGTAQDGPWSEPKTRGEWARLFGGISKNTFDNWRNSDPPEIRAKKVGRLFRVHVADIPRNPTAE